jgi:small-conductance mechanosensitive channel
MYLRISSFPDLARLTKDERKRKTKEITQKLSLGSKYTILIVASVILCIFGSGAATNADLIGAVVGGIGYCVLFGSWFLGHLMIVNWIVYPRINEFFE